MGPRCSSAETQVCHRSYIIAARLEPTIYHTCGKHANHYTTDAVAQVNIKIFAINPDLNENKEMYLLTCLWISDSLYIFKNPVTWYNIVTL